MDTPWRKQAQMDVVSTHLPRPPEHQSRKRYKRNVCAIRRHYESLCTRKQPVIYSSTSCRDHQVAVLLQGPKVEGGYASARSLSFDGQSAAAAARTAVPIDLMTVAARVDAGS